MADASVLPHTPVRPVSFEPAAIRIEIFRSFPEAETVWREAEACCA